MRNEEVRRIQMEKSSLSLYSSMASKKKKKEAVATGPDPLCILGMIICEGNSAVVIPQELHGFIHGTDILVPNQNELEADEAKRKEKWLHGDDPDCDCPRCMLPEDDDDEGWEQLFDDFLE